MLLQVGGNPNDLALSDHVRAEQVKLDSPDDVGDARLTRLAGGEVTGFLGLAGAGPVRPVADEGGGGEDLQQERSEREIGLLRGKKPPTVSVAAARACGKLIVSGGTPAAAAPIPMILHIAW